MQFRALSESSEARRRLEDLTPEERARKRRNYPGTLATLAVFIEEMNSRQVAQNGSD
jgi:hypothetical protein